MCGGRGVAGGVGGGGSGIVCVGGIFVVLYRGGNCCGVKNVEWACYKEVVEERSWRLTGNGWSRQY